MNISVHYSCTSSPVRSVGDDEASAVTSHPAWGKPKSKTHYLGTNTTDESGKQQSRVSEALQENVNYAVELMS